MMKHKPSKMITVSSCMLSLMVGVFIGTHAQTNTQTEFIKVSKGEFDTPQVQFYDDMIADTNTMEIYDNSEMTEEILTNRNGKIIVEKIIGEVTNYKLDGKILNCNSNNKGYINYERVDGAKEGDKILTYYIYNPFTNEQDDVLTRLDFIIDDNAI